MLRGADLAASAPTTITRAPTAVTQVRPPVGPPPVYYDYDEPPHRRTIWPWLLAILLIAAAAVAGVYVYRQIQHELNATKPVGVPYVVGLRELEGRSYAEIGEILELSPSAVETLIFRARRALREQLETSLTCGEAELAISRQLDGRLTRAEKGALRAHLRECKECAGFARRQRAQRTAIRSLAAVARWPCACSGAR